MKRFNHGNVFKTTANEIIINIYSIKKLNKNQLKVTNYCP